LLQRCLHDNRPKGCAECNRPRIHAREWRHDDQTTNINPDIEIDAALSWTSTQRLTLDAYSSIAFNDPVVVAGTGALTVTTNDGGSDGDFQFLKKGHVEFWDLTSSLIINGDQYILVKSIKTFSRMIRGNHGAGLHFAQPKSWNVSKHHYPRATIQAIFEGTFEGLGNTISHLNIHDTDRNDDDTALFEGIKEGGVLRDIVLTSVDISGAELNVASLAAGSGGSILNCHVSGQVAVIGGRLSIGGLVGTNAGTIERSNADVAVSGTGAVYVGGLVGLNNGFDEIDPGVIEYSHATGAVTGGGNAEGIPVIGGLIGEVDGGQIANSYATGAVVSAPSNTSAMVGGLIGTNNPGNSANPTIASTYATGHVSGDGAAIIGGLMGQDTVQSGITDSYWALDTSGVSDPSKGAGNVANDPGIKGLSDAQLKSGLPSGFNKRVWKEKAPVNSGYPYLIDNSPSKKQQP
jgi:The GLUG motif